jgi:hypothetical protein
MFGEAVGRLITGVLWGILAGLAVTMTREGPEGLRSVARGLIKGYLAVADDVHWRFAEARENIDDLRAEVRSEQAAARALPQGPGEAD